MYILIIYVQMYTYYIYFITKSREALLPVEACFELVLANPVVEHVDDRGALAVGYGVEYFINLNLGGLIFSLFLSFLPPSRLISIHVRTF